MFGHDGWRPLTVAALVGVASFLPQGIASAAPSPRHDAPFVGPVASSPKDPAASVAGLKLTGWASASLPPDATVTTASDGTPNATGGATPTSTPTPAVPASPGAVVSVGPVAPNAAAPNAVAPNAAAPTVSVTTQAAVAAAAPAGATASGSTASGSTASGSTASGSTASGSTASGSTSSGSTSQVGGSDDSGSGSSDEADDDSDSSGRESSDGGSRSSDDESSDRSGSSSDDSASSAGSGSSASGSTGATTSATTSAGSTAAGSASCPSTSGTPAAPALASGSVTVGGAQAGTDTGGAASITDVSKGVDGALGALGTATQPTVQTLAAPGAASSVAGATAAAGTTAAGNASLPGDVLDLKSWYLTLPTGQPGSPDTIENPSLLKFTNDFFKLTPARDGVVFSANGNGVTTKNSHYPRSELREMNGSQKAAWSNTAGTHTLDVCEAFTKLPSTKPHVVGAQIHDAEDDVLQIRLEGPKLMVQYNDGKSEALLDPAYKLGTPFNVKIVAANGKVDVSYNGQQKATLPLSGSGWYWKVGAYVQSNASKGDSGPTSTGEVTVYGISMVHA